jgi:hypothetical protein
VKILLIIDMQPAGFPLSRVVTRQVLRETALALSLGWKIGVVEFDLECAGPTDERIVTLLEASGVPWLKIMKAAEDGSVEIIETLTQERLDLSKVRFRVVGVTTDDCVTKTVHGLVDKLHDCVVEVVTDACTCWNIRYDWATFTQSPRVELINP